MLIPQRSAQVCLDIPEGFSPPLPGRSTDWGGASYPPLLSPSPLSLPGRRTDWGGASYPLPGRSTDWGGGKLPTLWTEYWLRGGGKLPLSPSLDWALNEGGQATPLSPHTHPLTPRSKNMTRHNIVRSISHNIMHSASIENCCHKTLWPNFSIFWHTMWNGKEEMSSLRGNGK